MPLSRHKFALFAIALTLAGALLLTPAPRVRASDHKEAPLADENATLDIADIYAFLDPNDNTKMVFVATLVGFIVPSENNNAAGFDTRGRFRFELEETGDAKTDRFIEVTFDPRTAPTAPQTAHITLPGGQTFMAPTTPPSLADTAPTPTITTDSATGVSFFAGLADDPFFFDIVGFNRFVASVLAHSPDPSQLNRGRDGFAGYNVQAIALDVPISLLNFSSDVIGVDFITQLPTKAVFKNGEVTGKGNKFFNIDRMGNPAVNTVLIPFKDKDAYNQATSADDAAGKFLPDLAGTLTALGTDTAHTQILASVALVKGDLLHVSRAIPNSGSGGGNNPQAAFPNGRRLGDDVIDTLMFLVTNEAITTGDHVNSNDVTFRDAFPFLAPPHQPLPNGTVDDGTRNKQE